MLQAAEQLPQQYVIETAQSSVHVLEKVVLASPAHVQPGFPAACNASSSSAQVTHSS